MQQHETSFEISSHNIHLALNSLDLVLIKGISRISKQSSVGELKLFSELHFHCHLLISLRMILIGAISNMS